MSPPEIGELHAWNRGFEWRARTGSLRRITTEQRSAFDRDGWIVIEDLLASDQLAQLTAELDEIEAEAEAFVRSQPKQRMLISESGAITFAAHVVTRSRAAERVSTDPAIIDLCHDLIGPDVRLYWDQLVYKKPDKPREFPWHQDNGYTFIEPQQYLTVWLALTDATIDNGCPWVAPGAHRDGTLRHDYVHPLGLQCFEDHPDATPAPVRAGGAVVFSSLTPHRTGPNVTDKVRKTYILQYAPDGVVALRGDAAQNEPEAREIQNDPIRQYDVLCAGEPVATP